MGFGEAIKTCFSKYAESNGRALRSEFWFFVLFLLIGGTITSVVDLLLTGSPDGIGYANVAFTLATLLPNVAVSIRRLHDIGKSGWLLLLILIPLVGLIILLVWFCRKGEDGVNIYGPPQLVRPN